jgi:hypothetical protein
MKPVEIVLGREEKDDWGILYAYVEILVYTTNICQLKRKKEKIFLILANMNQLEAGNRD